MKRLIIITIVVVFFVLSCADNNPEATRIQAEWDIMLQEASELQPVVEDWEKRHTQFLCGLTDDQLNAYEKYRSTSQTENKTAKIIKLRRLRDVLSEDEWKTFQTLAEESGFGWYPKAQELINRQQRLERQWEATRQNAFHSQQRHVQNQRMWQQYYQQQRVQQSLSGIENAIRNQNSGITVIPYNPTTDPQVYFRDGLMQGLGLPSP